MSSAKNIERIIGDIGCTGVSVIIANMKGEIIMIKKTITYEDFNGNKRTEDFWFNMSKAELMEAEMGIRGGLSETIQRIINTQDTPEIIKIFKKLVLDAYGVKSADGKRFIKSKELSEEFEQTNAYSELFMELATDADAASQFVNGIIPQDAAKQLSAQIAAANN